MINFLKKTMGFIINFAKFCFVFPVSLIIMATIKASLLFNIGKIIAFTKAVCNGKYKMLKESFNLLDEKIQTSKSFNDLLNNIDSIEELKSILTVLDDFKNLWATSDQCQSNLKRLIDARHRLPTLEKIFANLSETNLFKDDRAQTNFQNILNRNLDQELLTIVITLKNTDLFDDFQKQQEILDKLFQRTNPQLTQIARIMTWCSHSKIFKSGDKTLPLVNFERLFGYNENSKILIEVFESLENSGLLTGEHAIACFDLMTSLLYERGSSRETTASFTPAWINTERAKVCAGVFKRLKNTFSLTNSNSAWDTFNKIFAICDAEFHVEDSELVPALNLLLDVLDITSLFANPDNAVQANATLFKILSIHDHSLLNNFVEILVNFKDSYLLTGNQKYINLTKIIDLIKKIDDRNDLVKCLGKMAYIFKLLNSIQLLNQTMFDRVFNALESNLNIFIEVVTLINEIRVDTESKYQQLNRILDSGNLEFNKKFFTEIFNSGKCAEEFALAIQHLIDTPLLTDENSDKVFKALVDAGDKAVEVAKSFKHLIGTGLLANAETYSRALEIRNNKADGQANLHVVNQILEFLNQNALNLLTADNLSKILQLTKTDAKTVLQALQYFKESHRRDLLDQTSFDLLLASPASSVQVARLFTYSKTKNTLYDLKDIVQDLKVEQLGQEYKNMVVALTDEQAQVIHKLVGNLASAHALTFNILATLLSYKDDRDDDGKLLLTTLWEAIRLIDDAEGEFTFAPLLSQEFAKYPALLAIALKFHLYSKITDADIAIRKGSSAELLETSKKQEVEKLILQRVQAQFELITRYQISAAKPDELAEQIHKSLSSICMDKLDKDFAISPKDSAVVEAGSSSKNILGTYQLLIRVLDERASSTMNAARDLVGREQSDPQSVAVVATSLYKALGSIKIMPLSSDPIARNLISDLNSADTGVTRSASAAA